VALLKSPFKQPSINSWAPSSAVGAGGYCCLQLQIANIKMKQDIYLKMFINSKVQVKIIFKQLLADSKIFAILALHLLQNSFKPPILNEKLLLYYLNLAVKIFTDFETFYLFKTTKDYNSIYDNSKWN